MSTTINYARNATTSGVFVSLSFVFFANFHVVLRLRLRVENAPEEKTQNRLNGKTPKECQQGISHVCEAD